MENLIQKTFTANSDSAINSYGFRVLSSGIEVNRFDKNPVCLDSHWRLVGKWGGYEKQDAMFLVKDVTFSRNPHAQELKNDVEDGILNAVSMGFIPLEWSDDENMKLPGQSGPTVTRCQLVEVSLVAVPSNADAIGMTLYEQKEDGQLVRLSAKDFFTQQKHSEMEGQQAQQGLDLKIEALTQQLAQEKEARVQLEAKITQLQSGGQGQDTGNESPTLEQLQAKLAEEQQAREAMQLRLQALQNGGGQGSQSNSQQSGAKTWAQLEASGELLTLYKDKPEEAERLAKQELARVFAL